SPVTITICELSTFAKICSYVCGLSYDRKPLNIAIASPAIDAKNAGMPLLTMSMYFQPVVSSELIDLCACDSEPSMYANVSQPFMNTTTYCPATHWPAEASARMFEPRPAWPL